MPNWKSPGPDGVQGYWIKNLRNMHNSIALQLDRCLQENNLPKWMVSGKPLLCIKEIQKGNLVSNFRPITSLPLIWKLLTGTLVEEFQRRENCLEIFRAETYIPGNIISEDSKKESKTARGSKVSLYLLCLSYLHTENMEAKLTLKLITEAYLQASEHLEPFQLSFSFTPCSQMIVIVWRVCFTYLLLTTKIFCIKF